MAMATGPIMAMRQAMATIQGRSLITKAAMPANPTMGVGTGTATMGTATDGSWTVRSSVTRVADQRDFV